VGGIGQKDHGALLQTLFNLIRIQIFYFSQPIPVFTPYISQKLVLG
jgi:hypothetical protein